PLVNVALLAAAVWWLGAHRPAARAPAGPGLGFFLTLDFMAANLFLLFVALLPLRSRLEGAGKVASAGWQLCATPFFSRAGVAQEHALYFVLEGDECMLSKQYEQARQWYRRGLEPYPNDPANRLGVGCASVRLRDFSTALGQLRVLVNCSNLPPGMNAPA